MHLVSNFPLKCIVHYVNYNITVHDIYINVHGFRLRVLCREIHLMQ